MRGDPFFDRRAERVTQFLETRAPEGHVDDRRQALVLNWKAGVPSGFTFEDRLERLEQAALHQGYAVWRDSLAGHLDTATTDTLLAYVTRVRKLVDELRSEGEELEP